MKKNEGTQGDRPQGQNFDDVPVHTSESIAKRSEQSKSADIIVLEQLKMREKTLAKLLGGVMDTVKFQTVALTTIRTSEKLRKCSPVSLVTAVMMAAQRGLSLDPTLGHAYLVPYGNEAQYQTGYQGKIFLARRDGDVMVDTFIVHANDKFTIRRTPAGNEFEHIPAPLTEEPGEAIGWVARAHFPDGRVLWEVMRRSEVEKIRDTVKRKYGKDTPAWRDHFDEMGRGKVVTRLAKYLPQCPSLQLDAAQESALDHGGVVIDLTTDTDEAIEPVVVPAENVEASVGPLRVTPPAAEDDDIPFGHPGSLVRTRGTNTATDGGGAAEENADPGEAPGASGVVSGKAALGRYVAQAREEAVVAPAILAKALGVTPAVLSGLEKGQVAFTREQALAAAKCLNLHPDDILAIGGFAVESDNPPDNQQGESHESTGKDSQRGLSFKR